MSGRTLEDQVEALSSGYNSTTEWALRKLIAMHRDLEDRVTRLEALMGVQPEVVEGDPED